MTFEFAEKENQQLNSIRAGLIDFISGSLGGIALVYVGQPLDTVKVKMQTFPSMYKGMTNCFLQTLKADGIMRGLYAGTIPALVANVAENSVLFAAYGGCQKVISNVLGIKKIEDLTSIQNACAGFFAAFFSSLTLCPTELIKCKLQAVREVQMEMKSVLTVAKKEIGPWGLTRQILKEQGIKGLFTGLSSTIAREMPGYFFFFGGYEVTRELLTKPNESKNDIGWQRTMVAGAIGGSVLWLVIFPADVVKSRIQIKNLKSPALVVMKDIVKNEGISSLYNGLKPTLIRTVPATATLFVTYEYSKRFMLDFFENSQ
ncbi:mitochondrial ornithine transporter 1 [Bombus vancouverensis nearcticus]|uniref:Mitochondrial ornithine transporter 1 n=1 Tax=Bombus bifarius TaxID=103933 RepID=A0A6P8NDK9_9HYME|nr:mitochondrial ornithine transporter 1 [Bombus vancouverensis nearcticus]XP_033312657.1 mitochondrial ornithine transporter 1 [Bombus bifarius]XP_050479419.1 mitochondrial ornithine transporter 1 [Bombus huntii]